EEGAGEKVTGVEAMTAAEIDHTAEGAAFQWDVRETQKLSTKGRSQYLAGDRAGARTTFQQVEFRDPENAEARKFLQRIAAESIDDGELNREKTRTQLLEEVTKSWQRPGMRQEP